MFKLSQGILLVIISAPKDYSLCQWTQLNWKAILDLPECLSASSLLSRLNFRQTVPWWYSKYSIPTLQAPAERNRTDGKTLNQDAWTSNDSVYSCRAVLRQINLSTTLQKLREKKKKSRPSSVQINQNWKLSCKIQNLTFSKDYIAPSEPFFHCSGYDFCCCFR